MLCGHGQAAAPAPERKVFSPSLPAHFRHEYIVVSYTSAVGGGHVTPRPWAGEEGASAPSIIRLSKQSFRCERRRGGEKMGGDRAKKSV